MRNIAQYPLTDQEVQDWLAGQLQAVLDSQRVGGMDGMIIRYLQELVEAHPITTQTSTANS